MTPLTPPARLGNTTFPTAVALLTLRLALGFTFIFHGAQHAFGAFDGPGLAGTAKMFEGLHLPSFLPPTAWAVMAAYGELLGGIGVLLGLLTRLATLPILASMFVAIATVHGPHGFSLQNGGYEYNIALIAIATALLIAGPGLLSADALLFRRSLLACGPQPLAK